jgi:hypothetical protein
MSTEDLVQATVQLAVTDGAVTLLSSVDLYDLFHDMHAYLERMRDLDLLPGDEVFDVADLRGTISRSGVLLERASELEQYDDRTESQRQNETDSLRLQRDALTDEVETLRRIIGEIRMLANAGTFKEFDGEPWLLRVRNIDIHTPVAALTASTTTGERT